MPASCLHCGTRSECSLTTSLVDSHAIGPGIIYNVCYRFYNIILGYRVEGGGVLNPLSPHTSYAYVVVLL